MIAPIALSSRSPKPRSGPEPDRSNGEPPPKIANGTVRTLFSTPATTAARIRMPATRHQLLRTSARERRSAPLTLVRSNTSAGVASESCTYATATSATAALVLERTSVRGALRRSRALVRHSWWRVAGILILAAVVAGVLNSVLTVPFAIFGGGSPFDLSGSGPDLGFGALLLSAIGAIIAGTIVQPFNAGVQALLYVDRRMRAEGLDVTLAEAAARRGVPVA